MLEKTIIDKINETISQYVNQDELSENIVIINRLDKKLESLKNQRFNIEKSLEATRKNLLNLLKSYNDGVVTVSYTHLDVYKRQHLLQV